MHTARHPLLSHLAAKAAPGEQREAHDDRIVVRSREAMALPVRHDETAVGFLAYSFSPFAPEDIPLAHLVQC